MRTIGEFVGQFSFLSNFHPCKVEFEGQIFPSVENAYQAAKTTNKSRREFFVTISASVSKRAGRNLPLRTDWLEQKTKVMESCLRSKFSDPELRSKLIETGTANLVEGNWWGDTFWGCCRGRGENHLGKLLMKLREEFLEASK